MNEGGLASFILEAVKQVGFPIAVSLWLLWRTDRRLEAVADSVNKVEKSLEAHRAAREGHDG